MIDTSADRKICVGQFAGAHGVHGLVKLRSFTENPDAIFAYGPLTDKDASRVFTVTKKTSGHDHFLVAIEGIENKEAADALRGERLYIDRTILPQTKANEFYEADLVGLEAFDAEGKNYGRVLGFFDFGGGPFLEIGQSGKDSFMLPFKDSFVPEVDCAAGKILIVLPEDAS